MKINADRLPPDNTRLPKIIKVAPSGLASSVVTTDFFGFDTSDDHYKLRGLGDCSEMGDAVLGLVTSELGAAAPRWVAVRNVSDPQIKAAGLTPQAAGNPCCPDLQRIRALELDLQRHCVLGLDRR